MSEVNIHIPTPFSTMLAFPVMKPIPTKNRFLPLLEQKSVNSGKSSFDSNHIDVKDCERVYEERKYVSVVYSDHENSGDSSGFTHVASKKGRKKYTKTRDKLFIPAAVADDRYQKFPVSSLIL